MHINFILLCKKLDWTQNMKFATQKKLLRRVEKECVASQAVCLPSRLKPKWKSRQASSNMLLFLHGFCCGVERMTSKISLYVSVISPQRLPSAAVPNCPIVIWRLRLWNTVGSQGSDSLRHPHITHFPYPKVMWHQLSCSSSFDCHSSDFALMSSRVPFKHLSSAVLWDPVTGQCGVFQAGLWKHAVMRARRHVIAAVSQENTYLVSRTK